MPASSFKLEYTKRTSAGGCPFCVSDEDLIRVNLGSLKFILNGLVRLPGAQGDDDNDQGGQQEGGKQLVDAEDSPMGLKTRFQMNTMAPPVIMPAMAPALVVLFQNRENSIIGPKVAPNPAQAKETMLKITLFSSQAITIPIRAMSSSTTRETRMTCLSVAPFLKIPS